MEHLNSAQQCAIALDREQLLFHKSTVSIACMRLVVLLLFHLLIASVLLGFVLLSCYIGTLLGTLLILSIDLVCMIGLLICLPIRVRILRAEQLVTDCS